MLFHYHDEVGTKPPIAPSKLTIYNIIMMKLLQNHQLHLQS